MIRSVWYFPGDPAVPDFAAELGIYIAVAGAAVVGALYLILRRPRRAVRAAVLAALPGFLIAIPGLVIIAHRHFGVWRLAAELSVRRT
jgi:hypothetical protein